MSTPNLEGLSETDLNEVLVEARSRIEALQRQKLADVEEEFKRLAKSVGKTPLEIVQGMLPSSHSGKSPKKSKNPPKYCNPADISQTWTGVGKRPRWIHEALERGITLESMAIDRAD